DRSSAQGKGRGCAPWLGLCIAGGNDCCKDCNKEYKKEEGEKKVQGYSSVVHDVSFAWHALPVGIGRDAALVEGGWGDGQGRSSSLSTG
ncbi:MAG: hypothetical protein D3925_19430, partial [Candidatus Electrothrix sp. AR5]|nr:hypothetical protein [Candidatus Electrothrix sp. AR5]